MKSGQDYMRKSVNMCLTKVPESESTEDNIQPKVYYFIFTVVFNYIYCYIFVHYNYSLKKIKNFVYVKQCWK